MHRCKDHSKRFCKACMVQTAAFPIEHAIWERLMPMLHLLGL